MQVSPNYQGGAAGTSGGAGIEKLFWCPANEEGFSWQVRYGAPGGKFATSSDNGFGYATGEMLLQVDRVPFSYGYNDWGLFPPANGPTQKGLGGDIVYPRPNPDPAQYGLEVKASRVRKPAEMIAIGDNTTDGSWDYNIDPTTASEFPGKIHRNGANILFCDGHVQWYLQKDLVNVKSTDPNGSAMNRMWNNDNSVNPNY
jgi:prepilin-type processing-associated H-X9-DG protein